MCNCKILAALLASCVSRKDMHLAKSAWNHFAGGRGGANTPSVHCRGTIAQMTKPPNAQTGPCKALAPHRGM